MGLLKELSGMEMLKVNMRTPTSLEEVTCSIANPLDSSGRHDSLRLGCTITIYDLLFLPINLATDQLIKSRWDCMLDGS